MEQENGYTVLALLDVACRNRLLSEGRCNALTLEALGKRNAGRVCELRDR